MGLTRMACDHPRFHYITSRLPAYIEPHNTSVYAQYTVLVEDREKLQKKLSAAGIPTSVHYPITLKLQPAFAYLNKPEGSFPVAEEIAMRVMSLSMGPD